MGEVELQAKSDLVIIHSTIYIYGNGANELLSRQIAKDIAAHWNEAKGIAKINRNIYNVLFDIEGIYQKDLYPEIIYENANPRNNYFRIEEYAQGDISFVDGIGSNTGYFKLCNLLNNSTTAAHEFGHTLGLDHPVKLDIRGYGQPGIMFPRGTLVDPIFQYDPTVPAGLKGGTLNPFTRKVLQSDIDDLSLGKLRFNRNGFAVIGDFSAIWHEAELNLTGNTN